MFGSESDDDTFERVAPKKKLTKLGKRRRANRTSDDDDDDDKENDSINPLVTPNVSISMSAANTSHPAFNGSDAVAHSTPELHHISPDELREAKQKKRSFIADQLAQVSSVINDDQEESRQLAQEMQVSAASISDSLHQQQLHHQQKNDSKLKLGYDIAGLCLDVKLSSEQLSEHLANCIQLNAANKINKSNAFNLQLIDYMFVLLRRNDKTMQDFPTMSCSLDASTRIYACRVDSVHAGIMEIVTGLSRATDKNKKKITKDGDGSDGEHSDGDNANEQQTRARKRKAVIASSLDALCRTTIETASWMQRPAIQPDFTNLLCQASITHSDNSCLSLLQDHVQFVPLRRNKQLSERTKQVVSAPVVLPTSNYDYDFDFSWTENGDASDYDHGDEVDDHDCTMDDFSFNVHNNTVISAASHRNSNSASGDQDVDALPDVGVADESVSAGDIVNSDDQFMVNESFGDNDDDDHHCDSGDESRKIVENVEEVESKKKRHDTLSLVSGKALLAEGDSCYAYIDSDLLPDLWVGPDYWKPKFKRGKPAACESAPEKATEKKTRRKTKRTDLISFEDFSKVDAVFNKRSESAAQTRMISKWSEKKLTLPGRKNCKMEDIYRSFLRKTLFYKPFLKPEKDSTEAKIEFEYADDGEHLFNDANKMADIDGEGVCVVDNNQSDCDDYGDAMSPEPADNDVADNDDADDDDRSNVFSAENLVPLPKLVQCDSIKYATVPKRLDMKKLKTTIWSLLDLESDKENRRSRKSINSAINKDDRTFSNIYKQLPEHLIGEMRKDMSPALAFLAILHLANEKTLGIKSADSTLTDLVIKKVYFDGS